MGRLAGKVAFITGTAGGQGRAAALLFAKEGAHIIGCDVKVEDDAATVEMVRAAGGTMDSTAPLDLADHGATKRWIDEGVQKAGRIDILYNNASVCKFAPIGDMTPEDWSFTMRNELDLVYNAVNAAWPHFVKQRSGVILNTASAAGLRGIAGMGNAAHSATKGGLIAFTKQIAAEGARLGIRANSISPAGVVTPAFEASVPAEQRAAMDQMHPLGRMGQPEDVAYCALYLASDEASWVTAADFVLDGGSTSILNA